MLVTAVLNCFVPLIGRSAALRIGPFRLSLSALGEEQPSRKSMEIQLRIVDLSVLFKTSGNE